MSGNTFEDEIIDLEEDEKILSHKQSIEAMKKRYPPSMMVDVLHGLFPSERFGKFVFQTDQALIFPPVSDKVGSDISNIEKVIQDALEHQQISKEDLHQKILLFPLVQEQNAFNPQGYDFSFFPILSYLSQAIGARNHWVTLHYDPKTKVASLIDSRPSFSSFFYLNTPLQESLQNALSPYSLAPVCFQVLNQAVQYDDIHCGAWTALNIETLACGVDISYLMSMVKASHKDVVISHMIDKTFHHKKNTFLSTFHQDFDFIEEFNLSKPEIKPLLDKSLGREIIAKAISSRESVSFNGIKMSSLNPIGPEDLEDIFSDLREAYEGIPNTKLSKFVCDFTGYYLHDPGRLLNNLRKIGFSNEELDALPLTDILIYDAIIFDVISEVNIQMTQEYLTHLASFDELGGEFVGQMSRYYLSKLDEYRQSLTPIIKEFIKNNIALQESALTLKAPPFERLIRMKERPLRMGDLIELHPMLSKYKKHTCLMFVNLVKGLPQAIHIKTKYFIKQPKETMKKLLVLMKASGWDILSTNVVIYPSQPNKKPMIEASIPNNEAPKNESYWQGFMAMLNALLLYILNFASNLFEKTKHCFSYRF